MFAVKPAAKRVDGNAKQIGAFLVFKLGSPTIQFLREAFGHGQTSAKSTRLVNHKNLLHIQPVGVYHRHGWT